ncbi:hypothetical protein [Blastopirellula marina]|uniref:hypothetical protein n=1 Tax=Blastopirellula marina TaxID=124 RepID=UPI000320D5C9|nr:hypothetical protein [Blastopirellula marina]
MAATTNRGGAGEGRPPESLAQKFGDAVQEPVANGTPRRIEDTTDEAEPYCLSTSLTEFTGMSDLQMGKLAADTLAKNLQQHKEYHQKAANLFGSGSIAGVRDLGVPNSLRELKEKQRKQDELFYEWLQQLVNRQLHDLSQLARHLDAWVDKFKELRKQLQAKQDQAFEQLDALDEEMERYERTGAIDEARVRQLLKDRQVNIPAAADAELLYQLAAQEVSKLRHETEMRQRAMETCDQESQALKDQATAARETMEEVQRRTDQGIHAEEDAEALETQQEIVRKRMESARERFEQIGHQEEANYEANDRAVDQVNVLAPSPTAEIPTNFEL